MLTARAAVPSSRLGGGLICTEEGPADGIDNRGDALSGPGYLRLIIARISVTILVCERGDGHGGGAALDQRRVGRTGGERCGRDHGRHGGSGAGAAHILAGDGDDVGSGLNISMAGRDRETVPLPEMAPLVGVVLSPSQSKR